MKNILTTAFIALAVLALTLPAGSAQAADKYLFKYSNSQSDTHPRSVSMYSSACARPRMLVSNRGGRHQARKRITVT